MNIIGADTWDLSSQRPLRLIYIFEHRRTPNEKIVRLCWRRGN